ncbi:MAG: FumA C-terminus/TtdB family hydratase beta subunit [Armatimonadetes bacterium]|nr:FumA C-terminus/TtdB family hydratase beta subunit [Armatimonadota bacterium]
MSADAPVELEMPCAREAIAALKAGQYVALSGQVYTARDAAHSRLRRAVEIGEEPPVPLEGRIIYYCGPTPAPPGRPIGSCGPTSSARMDPYLDLILSMGVVATIGKGNRSRQAREALVRHRAVYFVAVGGAGALLSQRVVAARVAAYEDLGPEAIYELTFDHMPLLVAYDAVGGTIFAGEEPLLGGGKNGA